jgi:PTH1 family peptidyl-tRNA hydrolase
MGVISPMKLIIGLGNPGRKYEATRHNLGFWCVAELARRHDIDIKPHGLLGRLRKLVTFGEGQIGSERVVLAMPQTFMNLSGHAVKYLQARFRARAADIIIVYDEMDLPLGRVRLGPKGGSGGHRGMASIIQDMGTQDIPRIRIGVGRPPAGVDPIAFLISEALGDEQRTLEEAAASAADSVEWVLAEGLEVAMTRTN